MITLLGERSIVPLRGACSSEALPQEGMMQQERLRGATGPKTSGAAPSSASGFQTTMICARNVGFGTAF